MTATKQSIDLREKKMSRALNINSTEADVTAACQAAGIPISTIERLVSGGTRVVLNNAVDAAKLAKTFKAKLMTGPVTRLQTRLNRGHRGASGV
jgi:hypothetical protein